ncbi:MAG: class I SAM-dependent methyltransferase [Acetatifactor sp.]
MNIEEQFNFIAGEYDANRKKFIPCFDDYYEKTTKFITSNIEVPKRVLDLGAGTGLLTYYWFKECSNTEYVLVDIAEEMLEVSKKRFEGLSNVSHQVMDYTKQFPDGKFDTIISALSIHHLADTQKAELFFRIYEALPAGGVFVNYDQFCAGTPMMDVWFDTYWEKQLYNSGLTDRDIELWKERRKLDRECSVEKEVEMLRRCTFADVKCLYSCHKFSVIIAVK